MTKIPEDHTAARALYDTLVALGREQSAATAGATAKADERRSRWWSRARRRRGFLVFVPIGVLVAAGAATGAHVLIDDGEPIRGEPAPPAAERRDPRDSALAAARAADPYGSLPWGVRLYTSAGGRRCALVGQVKDGRLGRFEAKRRFTPYAADSSGSCGVPGAPTAIVAQQSGEGGDRRSTLYGFVDRGVSSLAIVDGARREAVPIAGDGSYVRVAAGDLRGTLVIRRGSRETRTPLAPGAG